MSLVNQTNMQKFLNSIKNVPKAPKMPPKKPKNPRTLVRRNTLSSILLKKQKNTLKPKPSSPPPPDYEEYLYILRLLSQKQNIFNNYKKKAQNGFVSPVRDWSSLGIRNTTNTRNPNKKRLVPLGKELHNKFQSRMLSKLAPVPKNKNK